MDKSRAKDRRISSARAAMLRVVGALREAGYQALLAGGCVRDMLLGAEPYDFDVATDARPEDVMGLFRRTMAVGAQFGVVVVMIGRWQIEVATFRTDADYGDNRRPDAVTFTDARHDAERRDFTINGMFLDPLTNEVIDYVGGQADLRAGIVRAIGDPHARIGEDHLRMLRAVRFAARLGFTIEPATWQALVAHAGKIGSVSPERILAELERILTHESRTRGMQLAYDAGLLAEIFPTLSDVACRTGLAMLENLRGPATFADALAAFLAALQAAEVADICRALRASNQLRRDTCWLVEKRPELLARLPLTDGRLKQWLAQPLFPQLRRLAQAWLEVHENDIAPLLALDEQIAALGDEPVAPPPLLDGHDLLRLGAQPGPTVGALAEDLYLAQLEGDIATRPEAEAWVRKWLQNRAAMP